MSDPEEALAFQLKALGIHGFVREFRFTPPRKHRADFAFPAAMLLVEVDGGTWVGGRHSSGAGFAKDAEKASLAAIAGYRVVHCVPADVDSGRCVQWIEEALRT